ncbi:MAG: trigger factor [Thermotogaceae bacterium]|nr:trigger factor [Thermotogaceae bacterium]
MERRETERDKNMVVAEYEFDEKELNIAEEKAARYLNQRIELPGFRKGKVPRDVLKIRLGEDFKEYVLDELLEDALKKEELLNNILLRPIVVDRKIEGNKALVKIEFHLEPEVKVPDYSGIELKAVSKGEVLDKYIEKRLEDLREEHALVEPKDGEAQYGDMVKVRMVVTNDEGKVLRDEKYEYVLVEDDDRPFVKDLLGKKKGDTVEFDREYEGKNFHYKIGLLEVYKRTLPELNDEFAKTVGNEFETLEKLKEHLKEEGAGIYDREMREVLRDQALEWLVENVELEISDKTLGRFVESAINKLKEERNYEKYVEKYESEEKLREFLRNYYLNDLKTEYGIKKIAELEGIKITEEDLEKEAEELSVLWGISKERAKVLVKNKEDIRNDLEWVLLKRRVLDVMVDKANVVELSEEEYKKAIGGEEVEGGSAEDNEQ